VQQHPDEQHWVRQAQAGDRDAFAALVEHNWPRLLRWLVGLTHNQHTAEELTQDVFLKAWTGLPDLQDVATFLPWLFRIARNCLISSRRGPRAAPVEPLPRETPAHEPGPEESALAGEGRGLLEAALGSMPASFRGAFLLWTQEDMPYADIARVLEVTEETARWRVCKARQFLLKQLESYLDQTQR
jgi:RNA polymerase sigma-70 factor (ECF subfamily)